MNTRSLLSGLVSVVDALPGILFAVVIAAPLTAGLFGIAEKVTIVEKRRMATYPTLEWSAKSLALFPKKYEAYFNDNFGLRSSLLMRHNFLKYKVMRMSPARNILLGKEDWLFFTGNRAVDYYRNIDPMTPELLAKWRRTFLGRKAWLASKGIEYVVVVAPNKETVYPEFMPDCLNKVRCYSRFDQIKDHVAADEVRIVPLKWTLTRAKEQGLIYKRLDSHWNQLGAFFASERIVRELSSQFDLQPYLLSDFEISSAPNKRGGDLGVLLNTGLVFDDTEPILRPKAGKKSRRVEVSQEWINGTDWQKPFATEIDDLRLPRAVMFRDSFGEALIPFMSEYFSRIAYRCGGFSAGFVEAERPDVVIDEFVERSLMREDQFEKEPRVLWHAPGKPAYDYRGVNRGAWRNPVALHQCSVAQTAEGLQIKATGNDPQIETGPLQLKNAKEYVVKVTLVSASDTFVQVFFKRGGRNWYIDKDSVKSPVKKGPNEIYFSIPSPAASVVQMRVDPGAVPGPYIIRQITIKEI